MTAPHRVAVIGLGAMGLPMAARLVGSLAVAAFDVDRERVRLAHAAGVQAADSPAQAARDADIVVLAVRTFEQAENALFGDDGVIDALPRQAVVVLTSTVGAAGARSLGELAAARGARLLDAPVSGGAVRAGSGELLIFLGGADDAVAAASAVIDRLASTVIRVGPQVGDGQSMKTINQLLAGVHVVAAAEALTLARALGLEPRAALEALSHGAAGSFMLENRGPRIADVLDGQEPAVFSRIDIFVKDMGLVAQAARDAGVPAPLAAAAEQIYRLAQSAGLAARDDSNLARLYWPGEDPAG